MNKKNPPQRAGPVGAGGLGDLTIRYGYQRFNTQVIAAVVRVVIALVCCVQWADDVWSEHLDHRAGRQ